MLQTFLSNSSSSSSSATTSTQEPGSIPCIILPRTLSAHDYDRETIIADIENHFNIKSENHSLRSLALWGLGGVGKSHIALKYAKSKINDFDAIFWIYSEGHIALAESFSKIAIQLRLPNTRPQNHEENRVAVLGWLQQACEFFTGDISSMTDIIPD